MHREIRLSQGNSPYVGKLAKGCRACMKGAKLVLFITGRCDQGCYYCPISQERWGKDLIFANEVQVQEIDAAVSEAHLINAQGMGITGGEPLLELERTTRYIRTFKQKFGEEFHIHLYTALEPIPPKVIEVLLDAGLDELRLHRFTVGEDVRIIREITKGRAQLGIEIPAIPGLLEEMKQLFLDLEHVSIDFVNINEMEFSPSNAKQLQAHGFTLDPDSIAAVQDSEKTALALLEWAAATTHLNVHYCPIALKDGTQLRNRFRRRAKNVAKAFERINREGILVKGVIIPPKGMPLSKAFHILENEFTIPEEQLWKNDQNNRLETSTVQLRRIANQLKQRGFQVGIVEEYPIDSKLQVSYTQL